MENSYLSRIKQNEKKKTKNLSMEEFEMYISQLPEYAKHIKKNL